LDFVYFFFTHKKKSFAFGLFVVSFDFVYFFFTHKKKFFAFGLFVVSVDFLYFFLGILHFLGHRRSVHATRHPCPAVLWSRTSLMDCARWGGRWFSAAEG
jgi:hypothetical protein